MNLSSIGIRTSDFINDSLCSYYKMFRRKYKELWSNKFVYVFQVSNGAIRLKAIETDRVYILTHNTDFFGFVPWKRTSDGLAIDYSLGFDSRGFIFLIRQQSLINIFQTFLNFDISATILFFPHRELYIALSFY